MKLAISLLLVIIMFSSCQRAPEHQTLEYPWKPYSQAAIDHSIAQHKPVVIDFWAEWCPNCHDLDREVFSKPDIKAKLAQVTALRMDVTNQDDPQIQKLLDHYGIEGVPTIIFLNAQGKEIPAARIIGFVTAKEFLQAFAMVSLLK